MATVTDINTIPHTRLNHIDALLGEGPNWNYLTGNPSNTLYYTFSTSQAFIADNDDEISGMPTALTAEQQKYTRQALDYLSDVTGINFVETPFYTTAQVHFVNADIIGASVIAECAWTSSYRYALDNTITKYDADAIVYLDNREWGIENANLAPGGAGYETLLHELGHMLGLKHPFSGDIVLPDELDDTSYTLMSYTSDGYNHASFSEYDIAALNWLYGRDGLRGEMGVNSAGGIWLEGDAGANLLTGGQRVDVLMGGAGDDVLTGYAGNDVMSGATGDDTMDGGAGVDSVAFGGDRDEYVIAQEGHVAVVTDLLEWDGLDTLVDVERLVFLDKVVALDIDGVAGTAYRLYQAAFYRTPDQEGLGYWIDALDRGTSLQTVAAGFMGSPEFARLYGSSNPDNASFVSQLYQNVLHRAPEQGGFDFWTAALNNGVSKAQVLTGFSESAENKAALIGVIGDGFDYVAYTA